jgi:hypothetical protein
LSLTSPAAQHTQSSFFSTSPSVSAGAGQAPAIMHFTYSIERDRVLLSWENDNNQHTDRFELERSKDGKKFSMAALVFGTDQPGTGSYRFFEKVTSAKIFYRIKIIRKDNSV